ncbi:MAG: TonB-dependent receptor [Alphaproteobacteria bacterium]
MAIALVAIGPGSLPCLGQTMNYRALEEIFGEHVTTSATGSPQKVADAPVNMEIISADDIRRSGADNIPDILRFVSGIDVRRYGATNADIGIRGYNAANSPRVLVLLNGRQIYVDYHSYTAWSTVSVQPEEIRQIEVIKGPNTALYGYNATAGVINIVTMDPIFDPLNQVTLRGGNRGEQKMSAIGTAQWGDKAGLRVSASEHGSREYSTADQPRAFGPYPSHNFNRTAYAHGRAELPSGITVSAEADVTKSKQFEMTVGGYPGWTAYESDREKVGVGGATSLGYLNLNAYRNVVDFKYFAGWDCITCVGVINTLYVVQASDLAKPAVNHTVRAGLEYRNNRGNGSAYPGARFGFDVYAIDGMWHWLVTPKVALTSSVRLDHMTFSYHGPVDPLVMYSAKEYNRRPMTEPSFNESVVYKPTPDDTIRLSAARAVQAPDFYALFPEPVDPTFLVGNVAALEGSPNQKPTIIMNQGVDYDHKLPALKSSAQVSLFRQTSQAILASPGDSGIIDANRLGYAGNIGRSRALGGELGLMGENDAGWRWKTAYSLVHITDRIAVNQNLSEPNSSIDYRRGSPVHSVVLGLGRSWDKFEADIAARWQSGFDDISFGGDGTALIRTRIDDYTTVAGRLGYSPLDNVTLAATGQQLNRPRLATTAGPRTERRLIGSITLRF